MPATRATTTRTAISSSRLNPPRSEDFIRTWLVPLHRLRCEHPSPTFVDVQLIVDRIIHPAQILRSVHLELLVGDSSRERDVLRLRVALLGEARVIRRFSRRAEVERNGRNVC